MTRRTIGTWCLEHNEGETKLTVDDYQLGYTLMGIAQERVGYGDDAGSDWATDEAGNTYIEFGETVLVDTRPEIAALVDAANILMGHGIIRATPVEEEEPEEPSDDMSHGNLNSTHYAGKRRPSPTYWDLSEEQAS